MDRNSGLRLYSIPYVLIVVIIHYSLALRGQALGKFYSYGPANNDAADIGLSELPLPYEVPLPEECTVPGSSTRSYNQGQCSRKPCTTNHGPCAESLTCCYEIGHTSSMEFLCSKTNTPLKGVVIVTCDCQVCDKLHTQIRGHVLSSQSLKPVVLAAIMVGSEVATFTDENGYFSFDLSTSNGDISLSFQETRHRLLELTVNIRHSKSPEINVVMEHIDAVQALDKLQFGADVQLNSRTAEDDGISIHLGISPRSLVNSDGLNVYEGSGQLLYSVYSSNNRPEFTSEALNQMIYTDSKGVEFAIQTYVICTMEILGDNGQLLSLRSGSPIVVKLSIKFDRNIAALDVSNLHLFTYSQAMSSWRDSGKVGIVSITSPEGQYGTLLTVQQSLREVSPLWAIGFPARVTCYIKAMVTNMLTQKEVPDIPMSVVQSDTTLSRPTFYQYSVLTSPGVGACLKAVCSLGGILQGVSDDKITAVPPDVDIGMVMGDEEQIIFYDTGKQSSKQTPYYPSEQECLRSGDLDKSYFHFTSNRTVSRTFTQPSLLPLVSQEVSSKSNQGEFCFVKVSVYDCAPFTEIKVLSYSSSNHNQLHSINTAVATGTTTNQYTCQTSEVVGLRAACVEFTCGSDIHVTVQSHHQGPDMASSETRSSTGHTMDCRYWSSSPNTHTDNHPSENMMSFHLSDVEGLSPLSGVYRAYSSSLALLQCMSGRPEAPANSIDPETGVAVTFTCLYYRSDT